MEIQHNKGDYVIVQVGPATVAAKIRALDGKKVKLLSIQVPHIQTLRNSFVAKASDILVNLGPTPFPGKVYGHDLTKLYWGETEHEHFGALHWFYTPPKDVKRNLDKAFNITFKRLNKVGLEFLASESDTLWEILSFNKEKYSGEYAHTKREAVPSILRIRPESMDASDYPYVIAHELGHRLHFQYARRSSLEAKWITLYNTSIRVTEIDRKISKQLLKDLIEGDTSPRAFLRSLDDDDKLAYRWILRYVKSTHSLSPNELDILWQEDKSELEKVWPNRTIPKKDLEPLVTPYATKHYKELIAESFAYYLCGKALPKSVNKLVERTISYAKAQAPN